MCISERVVKGLHCIDIKVYVKPKSRKTALIIEDDEIVFYTSEAPERGRANSSLIKYISRILGIPSRSVEIVSGFKNRVKTVRVCGVSSKDVMRALKADGKEC